MVTIVESPKDFTPVGEGLVFVAQSDVKSDFVVDIIDAKTDEVVGSKYIAGVERAVIDIAPYVEVQGVAELSELRNWSLKSLPTRSYYITVETADGGAVSEAVRVSSNLKAPIVNTLQTAMPMVRSIGYGEDDDLRVAVLYGAPVRVEARTNLGERRTIELTSCEGFAQLHLTTADLGKRTQAVVVEFYVGNQAVAQVEYRIVPRYNGAVRVGWVGPTGAVEHYTFPITVSKSVVSERTKLYMQRVEGDIVSNKSYKRLTLRSQALSEDMAEVLATILTAPKVWIEGEEIVGAQLSDSQVVTKSFNKAAVVEITLEYGGKEVVL